MGIAYAGATFANFDSADLAEIACGNRVWKSRMEIAYGNRVWKRCAGASFENVDSAEIVNGNRGRMNKSFNRVSFCSFLGMPAQVS